MKDKFSNSIFISSVMLTYNIKADPYSSSMMKERTAEEQVKEFKIKFLALVFKFAYNVNHLKVLQATTSYVAWNLEN